MQKPARSKGVLLGEWERHTYCVRVSAIGNFGKMIKASLGNLQLLKLHKTAFLCSRKVPASVVLKCYDWAIAQREAGNCVISGFHSPIEKDVLDYLLKGGQPIILVLARGLKKKVEPEFEQPLNEGRILIISPFKSSVTRANEVTGATRNKLMIELAEEIYIGHASTGGSLDKLLKGVTRPIIFL